VGTFLIFTMASILILSFGWVFNIEDAWKEAHLGAALRIPGPFKFIMKYVAPLYLLTIFSFWLMLDVLGLDLSNGIFAPKSYITNLFGAHPDTVSRLSLAIIVIVIGFFSLLTANAGRRWSKRTTNPQKENHQ
jgi:hypothetical protein